jgi:molybdopterin-containing oxidoreductase family iron-sulfur binding subunit
METTSKKSRYGMVIDLDRCNGCGACMMACAVENNVPPAQPRATERTGITWLRVFKVDNGQSFPEHRAAFVPMPCQQCEKEAPCVSVCPQNAVEIDQQTGIVTQVPVRCLGCRYCMAACPYHARYFNWWDPQWPEGMEKTLNPEVAPRMRGVVEKCNFCHSRLQAARAKAAAEGRRELQEGEYVPACVEACPNGAITFGDLADENSAVSQLARDKNTFRFLVRLGTEPKVYYHSTQPWVRQLAETKLARMKKEKVNG